MCWAGPEQPEIGKSRSARGIMAATGWGDDTRPALLCFSHLRWNFVYQRPQHLMSRFARDYRVLFWEEPQETAAGEAWLQVRVEQSGVRVLLPRLPRGCSPRQQQALQRQLLDRYLLAARIRQPVRWYYTPISLGFSQHIAAALTVYDCMDELAAFRGAPPELRQHEQALLREADLVFTGGYSLYEAKRPRHPEVHAFPSGVDVEHFAQARGDLAEPADQAAIPHPRAGFYGVIDERLDTALLDRLACARPELQLVLLGPVAKIDPASLPRRPNIHYLGPKVYDELPQYLAGWDAALLPFARNESTRFISPTKTPEYLAAGRPVASTAVTDVVRGYGDCGLVAIADHAEDFVGAVDQALQLGTGDAALHDTADRLLAGKSWDSVWRGMDALMGRHRRRADAETATAPAANDHQARANTVHLARRQAAFDYLIVGAGFAGSVLAERLAAGLGKRVMLIDRRPHIGGNAYDGCDADGVLVHRYGPHIFHTNAQRLVDYLSRFTQWRPYQHRVLASVDGQLLPMPINLTTLNRLYGLQLGPEEAERFLAARAERIETPRTAEDVVVGQVGRELYEKFFRGYTRKQWGLDPSQLDKAVTSRVPTRTSLDDRYFLDSFQQMPLHGYTRLFENMLDHSNIRVVLGTDFADVRDEVRFGHLIYSGPIDEYFDCRYGRLPYRSLQFRHETLDQEWLQPVAVVNYPSPEVPYTRITEYKHLTGQQHRKTSVTYEYPSAEGEPYYPVPRPENEALYRRYRDLAKDLRDVTFVGRLGSYRYYNMDQIVAQALAAYERIAAEAQAADSQPARAGQVHP
jgi:UDP-galactopyranose mutase